MPIYEYRCLTCDNLFEELQAYNADLPDCPQCGSEVRRIISAPSIKFRGHGYHGTDYTRFGPKQVGRTK